MAGVLRQVARQLTTRLSVSGHVTAAVVSITTPRLATPVIGSTISLPTQWTCVRWCSSSDSYDPYNKFETPSPYKKKEKRNYGYNSKLFHRGTLPRPDGENRHDMLPMKAFKPGDKDQWTKEKALFGQNDYIDLLGDGSIHPWQLLSAPGWLRGFKGNEFQRVLRQLHHAQQFYKEKRPAKYHSMRKNLFYLYKKSNRRRHTPYWGSRTASAKSRIQRIRDF